MGNIGGPGRPKGSRNKLAQEFVEDFYEVWKRKGLGALERAAVENPVSFIRIAADLIPRQFMVDHEHSLQLRSRAVRCCGIRCATAQKGRVLLTQKRRGDSPSGAHG